MLALIPLFDENMAVKAYSVFSQKDNFFLNPLMLGTGRFDGAAAVEGLELSENARAYLACNIELDKALA